MFKTAPLPFVGQKRMMIRHVEKILNAQISGDGEGWTIVDVFGGSGLLALAKALKPQAMVIYNDFDNYATRLNHIDDINRLRRILAELCADLPKGARLSPERKQQVIAAIEAFNGYKDVAALVSWLCFGGQQAGTLEALYKQTFWNVIRQSDYKTADGYLDGLTIVKQCYSELLPRYAGQQKTLLILDPPYLCTNQKQYNKANYFNVIDFAKLMRFTKPPFVLFSSTKSEIIDYIDFLQQYKADNWQSFADCERIRLNATVSHSGRYEDNILFNLTT